VFRASWIVGRESWFVDRASHPAERAGFASIHHSPFTVVQQGISAFLRE
jgi:hypothetical protein